MSHHQSRSMHCDANTNRKYTQSHKHCYLPHSQHQSNLPHGGRTSQRLTKATPPATCCHSKAGQGLAALLLAVPRRELPFRAVPRRKIPFRSSRAPLLPSPAFTLFLLLFLFEHSLASTTGWRTVLSSAFLPATRAETQGANPDCSKLARRPKGQGKGGGVGGRWGHYLPVIESLRSTSCCCMRML